MIKKLMTSAVALSLVAVPAVAQAADASKLSLSSQVRTGAVAKGERQDGEGAGGWIVAALAAAAVIGGIIIIADGDDDANSP